MILLIVLLVVFFIIWTMLRMASIADKKIERNDTENKDKNSINL